MKLRRFILFFSALFIFSQFCFAQEKTESVLIDEFGKVCSEDIKLNYDTFMIELQNDPDSKGYIIFNGENSQEGTNIRYSNFLINYARFRGFDVNRIILIRGENQNEMRFQFWKVPTGANIPKVEKRFETEKISSTIRFQKTYAELIKFPESEEELADGFIAFEGCDFAPNLKDFAKILSENNALTGYLVIYATREKAKKIKKFALKELTETHKISPNRLRTIYGDQKKESEMELWFVPKGEKFKVK